MKTSDALLNFTIGYLPSISALLIVAYFFQSFYSSINPYTYWFLALCIAISSSIATYRYRNRPLKKSSVNNIDKKINIKDWFYLTFTALMWFGGAYALSYLNKFPDGHIKNILLGMSLISMFSGARYFFEKEKSLKLIAQFKKFLLSIF